jgi:hypothetical protein
MELPQPTAARKRPSDRIIILLVIGGLAAIFAGGMLALHVIGMSGITKGPDNLFGDQHLKTAVALIELHKVRFGRYPSSLADLKFTGAWDPIALQNVSYYPNADRTAYYIEVKRGWIGKPDLKMPDEFWRGTGYDPSLKPKSP